MGILQNSNCKSRDYYYPTQKMSQNFYRLKYASSTELSVKGSMRNEILLEKMIRYIARHCPRSSMDILLIKLKVPSSLYDVNLESEADERNWLGTCIVRWRAIWSELDADKAQDKLIHA